MKAYTKKKACPYAWWKKERESLIFAGHNRGEKAAFGRELITERESVNAVTGESRLATDNPPRRKTYLNFPATKRFAHQHKNLHSGRRRCCGPEIRI